MRPKKIGSVRPIYGSRGGARSLKETWRELQAAMEQERNEARQHDRKNLETSILQNRRIAYFGLMLISVLGLVWTGLGCYGIYVLCRQSPSLITTDESPSWTWLGLGKTTASSYCCYCFPKTIVVVCSMMKTIRQELQHVAVFLLFEHKTKLPAPKSLHRRPIVDLSFSGEGRLNVIGQSDCPLRMNYGCCCFCSENDRLDCWPSCCSFCVKPEPKSLVSASTLCLCNLENSVSLMARFL